MPADDADPIETVTQSSRPAAGAPAVKSGVPNSIFALGAQAGGSTSSDERLPDVPDLEAAALKLLQAGDHSTKRAAEALGIDVNVAKRVMKRLQGARKVWMIGAARSAQWSLAKGGFQGWLRKKGAPSTERAAAKTAKRAPQRGKKAARKPKVAKPAFTLDLVPARPKRAAAAVTVPMPAPATNEPSDIELGLFNSGEISLAVNGQPALRLNSARTRKLLGWLEHVKAVLDAQPA